VTQHSSIGVLVAQLGTPDAPTAPALRRYLRQFLSDRRVIDYHPLVWQPILRGIILRSRPRRSARLYARIWTETGSPLLLHSQGQVAALQDRLGADFRVALGMTYGQPSIASALQQMESEGLDRIIVLPMFP
jgi:ferrochelatase